MKTIEAMLALGAVAVVGGAAALAITAYPTPVAANMAFARSTGISCSGCHSSPSDPNKQDLTAIGLRFQACIFDPSPNRPDCDGAAKTAYQQSHAGSRPTAAGPTYGPSAVAPRVGGGSPGGGYTPPPPPQQPPAYRPTGVGAPSNFDPGARWLIVQHLPNGARLDGVWTRRAGNQYDAVMTDSRTNAETRDVVTFAGFDNGQIVFQAQSTRTVYRGLLAPDSVGVVGGTTDQYPANLTWSGIRFAR